MRTPTCSSSTVAPTTGHCASQLGQWCLYLERRSGACWPGEPPGGSLASYKLTLAATGLLDAFLLGQNGNGSQLGQLLGNSFAGNRLICVNAFPFKQHSGVAAGGTGSLCEPVGSAEHPRRALELCPHCNDSCPAAALRATGTLRNFNEAEIKRIESGRPDSFLDSSFLTRARSTQRAPLMHGKGPVASSSDLHFGPLGKRIIPVRSM